MNKIMKVMLIITIGFLPFLLYGRIEPIHFAPLSISWLGFTLLSGYLYLKSNKQKGDERK